MKLSRLGENRLLGELLPSLSVSSEVIAGAGDDCAIVKFGGASNVLVLKTDCVIERIHFEPSARPELVGWKAMMRPLSDFAAVSARPMFALVTLMVSPSRSVDWVKKLYRGLKRAAARFEVSIVGGETSRTIGPAAISVDVVGAVERKRWVSRAGGRVGDDLFVTGRLGGSRRGKHLRFVARIDESRWLTRNFPIHAMMDLSDGLGADLPRLAAASKVGFVIDEQSLPRSPGASIRNAIVDGEDFELLFAISSHHRARLERGWKQAFPKLSLTRIGRLNRKTRKLPVGYVHFQ